MPRTFSTKGGGFEKRRLKYASSFVIVRQKTFGCLSSYQPPKRNRPGPRPLWTRRNTVSFLRFFAFQFCSADKYSPRSRRPHPLRRALKDQPSPKPPCAPVWRREVLATPEPCSLSARVKFFVFPLLTRSLERRSSFTAGFIGTS